MVDDGNNARTPMLDLIRARIAALPTVAGRARLGSASPLNAPKELVVNVLWMLDEIDETTDEADAGWFGEASTSIIDGHTLSGQIEFMKAGDDLAGMGEVERAAMTALRAARSELRGLGGQRFKIVGAALSSQKAGQDPYQMLQLGFEIFYQTDGATGQVII